MDHWIANTFLGLSTLFSVLSIWGFFHLWNENRTLQNEIDKLKKKLSPKN